MRPGTWQPLYAHHNDDAQIIERQIHSRLIIVSSSSESYTASVSQTVLKAKVSERSHGV